MWVGRSAVLKGRRVVLYAAGGPAELTVGRDVPYPYCFAYPEDVRGGLGGLVAVERCGLRHHITGREVVRLDFASPSLLKEARDGVLGYDRTFEADVPYLRRLYVDGVLRVDYGGGAYAFIDVEVDDSRGFPVPGKSRILSVAYSLGGTGRVETLHWSDFGSDAAMVEELRRRLVGAGATVLVGWNVSFDVSFLSAHGGFEFAEPLDLMEKYKGEVKGLESYSLASVAEREGLGSKSRTKPVHAMTRDELLEYNVNDVRLLMELDSRYGFVELTLRLAEAVNLPVSMLSPVRIGDTLILRRARELGYVLSNAVRGRKTPYQGAYVAEPRLRGLVRNVAVFDFESMYPNIIVNEGIDIPGFSGEVLPHIIKGLLERRREAKRRYAETGERRYDVEQRVYKVLANALYGLFGTEGFRFMDVARASAVTGKGRELIRAAFSVVEELGYVPVYGDTDSVFVSGWEDALDLALIERALNERLAPYRVKLEYWGDMYILAKKRYIFRTSDGRLVYKGVEVVRGDWARLFKRVVEAVVGMLLEGRSKEVASYLAEVRRRMLAGEYDRELVFCKSFNARHRYKSNAEHVRAAKKYAAATGTPLEAVTEVCYVYVPYGDGVEPVVGGRPVPRLDYRRYWARLSQLVRRLVVASVSSLGDAHARTG